MDLDKRLSIGAIGNLWAKRDPSHPLLWHSLDVGLLAERLLVTPVFSPVRRILSTSMGLGDAELLRWVPYVFALHDIGKCDCDFQAKWPEAQERLRAHLPFRQTPTPGYRHEARSGQWLLPHLQELGWDARSAATLSAVTRGHHGRFEQHDMDSKELPVEQPTLRQAWSAVRDQISQALAGVFAPPDRLVPTISNHSTAGTILVSLLVMSDWIASNHELFGWPAATAECTAHDYATASRRSAEAALDRLGLLAPLPFTSQQNFQQTWGCLKLDRPRPVQQVVSDLCTSGRPPGLVIIEAPMGEGKTEAAIHLASHWVAAGELGGIYIALPTAATSNQMHGRMQKFMGQYQQAAKVGLVHGMSWMLDDASPASEGEVDDPDGNTPSCEWFRPSRRALLAPFAVGTVDQAMMAMLHVKFGFLRLLGLAKGVLVIDEVHAYDAYMSTILDRLLEWCGVLKVPVILLSATLPVSRKMALLNAYRGTVADNSTSTPDQQGYPLVTTSSADGIRAICCDSSIRREVSLEHHLGLLGDHAATAQLARQTVTDGGCACVILNTVGAAQEVFRQLGSIADPDTQLLLFHSRFPAGRRAELEQTALRWFDKRSLPQPDDDRRTIRPAKAILVATQVVEQSLDLDFDVLITEMAPLDLVLQRVGRLHRHDRTDRPTGPSATVHILLPAAGGRPDFGPSEHVYSRFILLRSLLALQGRGSIQIPDDVRPLIETVYHEDSSRLPDGTFEGISRSDLAESLAVLESSREHMRAGAEAHLIPGPYARGFKLTRMTCGAFDDDGDSSSYFHASTRYGEQTVRVILLQDGFGDTIGTVPH